MILTRAGLKNPSVVAVVAAIFLLVGLVSIFKLPVQLLPDIEKPIVSVIANWRSADPKAMESEMVQPLEEVLIGVPGLETIESNINQGFAFINMEFNLKTDMDQTLIEVLSRLNRLPPLPADSEPPNVLLGGFRGSAQDAIVSLFARFESTEVYSRSDNIEFLKHFVLPQLEAIPGVASVDSFNTLDQNLELQIIFDPYKAAALGVDITALPFSMGQTNDVSGGIMEVGKRAYNLRFQGKYDPADLSNLIVDWRNEQPIRLADFAEIQIQPPQGTGIAIQNGEDALYLRVIRANGANVMSVLGAVESTLQGLNDGVLKDRGMHIAISFNPAQYISRALNMLTGNLFFGIILAIGALWWFLRKIRATFIIGLTIPVSLLATIVILSFTGRSINVISLAGLAFATGMVLDAAIVVLENIVRMRSQGISKEKASFEGATQVWGALLASTATTVAIFLPVLFLKSAEGQLFADLALTLALSVSISLFVAIIIVPVVADRFLRDTNISDVHKERWNRLARKIMVLTAGTKRQAAWVIGLMIIPIALSFYLMPTTTYLPPLKADTVYVNFFSPPGTAESTAEKEIIGPIVQRLEPYLMGEKEPSLLNYGMFTFGGGVNGFIFIRPKDTAKIDEIISLINNETLANIPDVTKFAYQANLLNSLGSNGDVSLHLQASDTSTLEIAAQAGKQAIMEQFPGVFVRMNPDVSVVSPVLNLVPNDERIREAGLSRLQMGNLVRALGNGFWLGEYFDTTRRLDIILKSKTPLTPEEFSGIPIFTPQGSVVTLGSLAEFERKVDYPSLKHFGGRGTITLTFTPPDGISLQDITTTLEENIEPQIQALLPSDGNIVYGGSADSLKRAVSTLGGNFLLALALLFLIMAALFKSLKDSLLVVISIPLATVGGVIAIRVLNFFTFQPMDLLTMIGFIILLGLVVNNAILLVAQTRRCEAEGLSPQEAVEEALRIRIRPIFMSTMTSILGMSPLLLFPGEGSVIYRGMAAAIVGGMSLSTIFTLLLLPSLLQLTGESPRKQEFFSWTRKNMKKSVPAE